MIGLYSMKQLTIGQLLLNAGETEMTYLPGVAKALRFASILELEESLTASQVYELLRLNEPKLLDQTLHDILRPTTSTSHNCMTIIASAMMVIMSLAYAATSIWISLTKGVMVEWEEIALPICGPLLIVLHDRNIIAKENRGMMQAVLGNIPMTMMEAVSQRIAGKFNVSTTSTPEEVIEDIEEPKKRRSDY